MMRTNEKLALDQIIIQSGLFNQISTDQERGERIKKHLNTSDNMASQNKRRREQAIEEEDEESEEWMDDDALNQILGRDEQEMALLQAYDREKGVSVKEERFISYDQIPSFVF